PDKYKNPYNYWFKFKVPIFWERFKNETNQMDHEWKLKKWNGDFRIFSNTKFNDLYSIIRSNIPDKQKKEKIDSFMNEFDSEFNKFLFECKKEMRDNKKESESKKEMREDKTESESEEEMTDNKTESESKKEMIDDKTESESKKEMIDNKTESESMKEMIENKTEFECKNEMRGNKTESEPKKEMIDDKTESEYRKEQGTNDIKNYKKKIWELLIVLIILRRI
ncbi:fam-g protein, partial [Plasmodium gallinaceum]